jgi:hypothetical protein
MTSVHVLVYICAAILSWQYSRLLLWLRVVCARWWATWIEVVIGDGLVLITGVLLVALHGFPTTWVEWGLVAALPYFAWGMPIIWWQRSEEREREESRGAGPRAGPGSRRWNRCPSHRWGPTPAPPTAP